MLVQQGDILKVERIGTPVLVLSKDVFNNTERILVCPLYKDGSEGPLHIKCQGKVCSYVAHCENIALLDIRIRGYSRLDHIKYRDIMEISDAVQGIFDYY